MSDGTPILTLNADLESVLHLQRAGVDFNLIALPEIPRSAEETASACGCDLAHVLKALLFIGSRGAILAVVPGHRRVSARKLGRVAQAVNIRLATKAEVLGYTRSPIGQVSPFTGLAGGFKALDVSILQLDRVWLGSGRESVLLSLGGDALKGAWDGAVGEIAE